MAQWPTQPHLERLYTGTVATVVWPVSERAQDVPDRGRRRARWFGTRADRRR